LKTLVKPDGRVAVVVPNNMLFERRRRRDSAAQAAARVRQAYAAEITTRRRSGTRWPKPGVTQITQTWCSIRPKKVTGLWSALCTERELAIIAALPRRGSSVTTVICVVTVTALVPVGASSVSSVSCRVAGPARCRWRWWRPWREFHRLTPRLGTIGNNASGRARQVLPQRGPTPPLLRQL